MSVRPIDLMMVQQMNEVSQIKHNETSKPMTQQVNISAEVQKEVDNKSEQVTQKADVDNGRNNRKFDAKDKSDNEYHGQQSSRQKKDGKVTIKNKSEFNFDVKV